MAARRSSSTAVVEAIHCLLATVCLTSVFIRSGYCDIECQGDQCSAETTRISDSVNLAVSSCTTSLIEVSYTKDDPSPDNTLTIRYTCELHNGTQLIRIVEDEVLFCATNHLMDTRSITNPAIERGSMCQFYGCSEEDDIFAAERTHMRVDTVTCTVVDVDVCNEDCRSKGASECRPDVTSTSPSGYECVCRPGYVWNGMNCADVDECNTTDPLYQHNCTEDDGAQCVNLEGTFTCEQCASEDMWNGTNCVPVPATGMIPDHITTTTIDVASTPDIDTTGDSGTPTVDVNLPMVDLASVPLAVVISLVMVGLILAVVLILACLLHQKKFKKSVHAEANYSGSLGYVSDELDMNYEPLESIDVQFSTYPESVSVVSQLNRLWDPDDTDTAVPTTLPQNTVIDTQRQSRSTSSETESCINPSSELPYHIDGERDNRKNAFTHTDGDVCHNRDPSSLSSLEEVNDQLDSKLDVNFGLEGMLSTGDMHPSATYTQRFFAPHQTAVHIFRQSSASVLESDQTYSLDVTGGGVTDSGYIVCSAQTEKDQT